MQFIDVVLNYWCKSNHRASNTTTLSTFLLHNSIAALTALERTFGSHFIFEMAFTTIVNHSRPEDRILGTWLRNSLRSLEFSLKIDKTIKSIPNSILLAEVNVWFKSMCTIITSIAQIVTNQFPFVIYMIMRKISFSFFFQTKSLNKIKSN